MRPKTLFFDGFLPEEDEATRAALDLFREFKAETGGDLAPVLYGDTDPRLALLAEAMVLSDRLAEVAALRDAWKANDPRRFQTRVAAHHERRALHNRALWAAFEEIGLKSIARTCAMDGKAVTMRLRIEEEPGRIDDIHRATDALFADIVGATGDEVIDLLHTPPTLMARICRLHEAAVIPDRAEELKALHDAWGPRDLERMRPVIMAHETRRMHLAAQCRHRFIEDLATRPLFDGKTTPPMEGLSSDNHALVLGMVEGLFMDAAKFQGDAEVISEVERHNQTQRPMRVMALYLFSIVDQLAEYDAMEAAFQDGDLDALRVLKDAYDERIEVVRPLLHDLLHYTNRSVQ